MEKILTVEYKSPVGELIIGEYMGEICLCDWKYRKQRARIDERLKSSLKTTFTEGDTATISSLVNQLNEYFERKRKNFDIPLLFVGTDFQKKVWSELLRIPYGTTETYLGLSKRIANEKAVRAVAAANGANAISILVPCHRIIGQNKELIGYAGGLDAKKKILKLEGVQMSEQLSLF